MASTYSSNSALEIITTGDLSGTWGDQTNKNWRKIEEAVGSSSAINLGSGTTFTWTLSDTVDAYTLYSGTSDWGSTGRSMFVKFTATGSAGAKTISIRGKNASSYPQRLFFVENATDANIVFNCNSSGSTNLYTLPPYSFAALRTNIDGTDPTNNGVYNALLSHSLTSGELLALKDPGVTGAVSLPLSQIEELEELRYAIRRNALGSQSKVTTGSADSAWFDGNVVGPNLITNGAFLDYFSASDGTVPQGWALQGSGTPTVNGQSNTDKEEGRGPILKFTSSAANQGVKQTLAGVNKSTKYLVEARVKPDSGDRVNLKTTGALGSGSFQNLDMNHASNTWTTLSGIVETDTTPTAIVVIVEANTSGDIFELAYVACKEVSVDSRFSRLDSNDLVIRKVSSSNSYTTVETNLKASVVPPCDGCTIEVNFQTNVFNSTAYSNYGGYLCQLEENASSKAESLYQSATSLQNVSASAFGVDWINTSPTAGTKYEYTVNLDPIGYNSVTTGPNLLGPEATHSRGGTPGYVDHGTSDQRNIVNFSWLEVKLRMPK